MTAKEMLNKVKCNTHEMIDINESELRHLMNEYARHIAEKAMHEVSNEYTFTTAFETRAVTLFGNEILSRIKTLTEE